METGLIEGGRRPLVAALCVAIACGTGGGCAEFDTTPAPSQNGTLGEEIVQIFCERMAREADPTDVSGRRWKRVCEGRAEPPASAPPRLLALHANRARLVDALDRTLPESMEDELGIFLGELMPFFDPPSERLPTQTRRLADFLTRLARDDEALAALERIGTRQGYRPLPLALGVTRPVLAYPDFDRFADLALRTLLDGSASEEFADVQRALALEMATMQPAAAATEETTLEAVRDLMFRESDAFMVGGPSYVVVRDRRGLATPVVGTSGMMMPFADADRDGLADVDPLGRFLSVEGRIAEVPTPFAIADEGAIARDSFGRALRADGSRYWQYLDANRTLLAGATAELAPWFDPASPTLMQMSRGLPLLMGGEVAARATYGSHALDYTAFATDDGALFDAVYAMGSLLHRPQTEDALVVAERLLRDHESDTAGLLRVARQMANEGDLHPTAQLTANSIFWDEKIELVTRMSRRPGMLEAVMRSFTSPDVVQLGPLQGAFMRYRDRVSFDPANPNGPPVGLPLDEPVDRSMPDTWANESLFQRTVALIDGLNNVTVCNKQGARLSLRIFGINLNYPLFGTADACDLFEIENVAEAYALSVLGQYELEIKSGFLNFLTNVASGLGIDIDAVLEESSGIDGLTRRPTPQALNRLVFWGLASNGRGNCADDPDNCNSRFAGQIFAPVRDRHGNDVIERYGGTIFAWEMPGFYEGLRPLVEAMHRPGYRLDEEGRYQFGELIRILTEHWPSPANTETCSTHANSMHQCTPGSPRFSRQSNARSYEPIIANGFIEGRLFERLHRLNVALDAIEVRPGVDGIAALAAATEVMVDPARSPDLADRDGRTEASFNDGSRRVPMTPLYLLLDALAAMDASLANDEARRTDWRSARHAIAEQFLGTTTLGEEFRLENQRARAILLTALPYARERIAQHRAAGDLEDWSTGLADRMAETMREPLFSALIRFLDAINQDPEARDALGRLLAYLVTVASANDAFASTLHGAADLLMLLDDDRNVVPLLRALSESLAPNVRDVIAGRGDALDIERSALRDTLDLVQDIGEVDDERTLRVVLQNAVQLPAQGNAGTPLETIVDVIAEVNRAAPNEGSLLAAGDYRAVLDNVSGFLTDERHGLERLNRVVQQRRCYPEQDRECSAIGEEIPSTGLCYAGATCECEERPDGQPRWNCSPP